MPLSFWRHMLGLKTRPIVVRRASKRSVRIVPYLEQLESRLAPATTFSIAPGSNVEPAPGGMVNLDFIVTRSGDTTSQVTVGYKTVAGTAQPNTDYTPTTTGTTMFASGSATATIAIPIFGNGVYNNPSLTFSVQLTGITNVVGPAATFATLNPGVNTFATGKASDSVAVGDFNGDGKPDLAIVNYGSASVSVLLNTTTPGAATPTFALTNIPITNGTTNPFALAVADINGDGKPDLVVTDKSDGSFSVLLNKTVRGYSTANFGVYGAIGCGGDPEFVAVGDFNGDGKPDLVFANRSYSQVLVLLNTTATGSYTPAFSTYTQLTTGSKPTSVAVGDLNGDGRPDLVVANQGSNTASVFLNTTPTGSLAKPTFALAGTFTTGAGPSSVAISDLNGDGKGDLVFADANDKTVSVLLNTTASGPGMPLNFAAPQTFAVATNPVSVAVADLNGDGKPDLIVSNATDNNTSVLLNMTPTGATVFTFAVQQLYSTGAAPRSAAVADLNGDGKPDLIIANYGPMGASYVSVLLNKTVIGAAPIVPGFPQSATAVASTGPYSVAIGDLNGDGKPDLAVANFQAGTVSVLLNTTAPGTSTPTFAPAVNLAVAGKPMSVAIADVNGDGRLDLVVANFNTDNVSVLLNNTTPGSYTPSFYAAVNFAVGVNPRSVAVADLNGDGRPDIVVANENTSNVSVLLNNTTPGMAPLTAGSFASAVNYSTGTGPVFVAVADLNGDGKPDLVVVNYQSNNITVLLNSSAGGNLGLFTVSTRAVGSHPVSAAIGDLNGDGRPDIAVANEGDGDVSVVENALRPGADVPFYSAGTFTTGANPRSIAITDVNGDGKPDLVVANKQDNNVSVLLNATPTGYSVGYSSGSFTFAAQQTYAAGNGPVAVAVGDFNGDGRPDLAVANYSGNNTSLLLNTPNVIPPANSSAVGTITENDPPPTVQFNAASETVDAIAGTFSITVTQSELSDVNTTIPFTLGGTAMPGLDYNGVSMSPLVIAAGQMSGTITGNLTFDPYTQSAKTLTFTLGAPMNAALGSNATNTLTISEVAPLATTLVFLQQPGNGPVLQPINPDVLVQVLDQYGNPITTGGTVTIAVASGSPGDFDSASTVSAPIGANGVADFNNLILDVTGVYSFTAGYGSLSATSASFTASVTIIGPALDGTEKTSNVPRVAVGDTFYFAGFFVDSGAVALQAVISWNDGSVTSAPVNVVNQQGQFDAGHVYSLEGSYTVSFLIEDAQGRVVSGGSLPGPVQVVPDPFGPVGVIYGVPGETVTQSVVDPATGTTIIVTLTLSAGDPDGGYLLVTPLRNVSLPTDVDIEEYVASFDVREFDLPPDATATVSYDVSGDLPAGTQGELLYQDRGTNPKNPPEKAFKGDPRFAGPDVRFGLSMSTSPQLGDLTGTVFTIAAAIPGQTTVAAISPSVASNSAASDATIAVQTATFRTTNTLTLTLEPTQASQVSSTLATFSTDGGGGGGGDDSESAANALLQFLFDKLELLPKLWLHDDATGAGGMSSSPPAPAAAPTTPETFVAPSEAQESLSALDLFCRDPAPAVDWFTPAAPMTDAKETLPAPRFERGSTTTPAAEKIAYAAAAGAGLYISAREKRRKNRG